MLSIVRAEYLKTKKSMGRVLIWVFPMIVFVMAFVFTLGMTNAYAESVWNWWYTLLLPGMLAIICYLSIMREKKTRYYNLMTLSTSKRKLMIGKIIYLGCVILVSDMIVFVGASLGGFILTTCVPLGGALAAVLVLTISQLWEKMGRIEKRRSSTLSGIFLRYVLVMLGLLLTLGICTVLIFNILVNTGGIYPANYAEKRINEAYDLIQNADEVTEDIVPDLCHYVIFSMDGAVLRGNIPEDSVEIAWNVANHGTASGAYFYKVIPRADEYVVLQYSLTPQYQSAFLREHFIEPQNLMTILVVLGGITIILLPSASFGKKMKRKMKPVMNAVERIKNQDLE